MDVKKNIFSAPGKIILFGEHSVVYGHPAIVTAINLRTKCVVTESLQNKIQLSISSDYFLNDSPTGLKKEYIMNKELNEFIAYDSNYDHPVNPAYYFIVEKVLDRSTSRKNPHININSEIPPGIGLGSSAANSVASLASLSAFMGLNISMEELNELAFEAEKIVHGRASGVDNTISTYGGIQFYKEKNFSQLNIPNFSSYVVIVNSGIPRKTKTYVEKVAKSMEEDTKKYQQILEEMGNLTIIAKDSLMEGNIQKLGNLMTQNHLLLKELGVSHPILTDLTKSLVQLGSLGSKLTGAGGGGCVIGLFDDHQKANRAIEEMNNRGFQAFISCLGERGVHVEQ
ncbi:MAG: mevalonate kinase [Candidatus Heimdallarchaeaceae archaeon]